MSISFSALFVASAVISFADAPSGSATQDRDPERTELGLVPLVGGSSDYGVGVGALGSIASFSAAHDPYRWRLEFLAIASFRPATTGQLEMPFQDYALKLTLPDLNEDTIRLEMRGSFTRSSAAGYYGIGNATPVDIPGFDERRENQYDRISPQLWADVRIRAWERVFLHGRASYIHNFVSIYEGSRLEADVAAVRAGSASPAMQDLLRGTGDHGIPMMLVGLLYDGRDNETSPESGEYCELSFRAAPVTFGETVDPFWGVNANLRRYTPLGGPGLVLATRLMGDLLGGGPPHYELARSAEGSSFSGEFGIRGVPSQRFVGKVKLLANAELRAHLWSFELFDQPGTLGIVTFVDAGRVWADYHSEPELDGTALGIKYGVGGGFRAGLGETFVVRADVAWSPDAEPIGIYFNAGQVF